MTPAVIEHRPKPAPIDLTHHYSSVTKNRNASSVKQFYKYFSIPGIGNLAGGLPNNNYFPFDTLEASTALPDRFPPTPNSPVDPPAKQSTVRSLSSSDEVPASHVVVPKVSDLQDPLRKIDIKSALQYGTAQGYPPLYSYLRQFTTTCMHPNVPYAGGPEIIITSGSTDGFAKTIEALSNTWNKERDRIGYKEGLLVEEFCYMNAIQTARPRGLNIVPVALDGEGMRADGPGGLQDVLEHWDAGKGKRPHLMYTVTIGQNPTSGTLGVKRRKEIYDLCCKYDIIIIEDDPYWYLQYPSANGGSSSSSNRPDSMENKPAIHTTSAADSPKMKSSGHPFLDSLVPSYLSVDHEGRVVRLDTFSKTIAPGCRLGWITAQPNLCERLLRITETSTQQPSGFVQSIVAELIMGPHSKHGRGGGKTQAGWHIDGWVRWLEGLRGNYERRMNTMCNILDEGKQLVKVGRRKSIDRSEEWGVIDKVQIYDFDWPLGGMFVWIKLNFSTHPLWKKTEPEKLAHALWVYLTTDKYLVLVAPGAIFAPTEQVRAEKSWAYFRICFAAVDEPEVEKTSRRFVAGVQNFWTKKKLDDIEDLGAQELELNQALVDLRGGC